MKFTSKLAAAVIATAAFSSANATVLAPVTGDSEILVFLRDTGTGSSYSFDTGVRVSQFDPFTARSINLASGGLFAEWKALTTGTIQFSIVGGDSSGTSSTAGSRNLLFSTTAGVTPVLNNISNNVFGDSVATASSGAFLSHNAPAITGTSKTTMLTDLNGDGLVNGSDNGDQYTLAKTGGSSFGNWNGNILLPFGISMVNAGDNAEFFKAVTSGTGSAKPTVTDFYSATETNAQPGGYWTLSNTGLLNYSAAPVPEASEWAMMLAGLGFISLMVRRRSFSA
jgi:hypothetical protein